MLKARALELCEMRKSKGIFGEFPMSYRPKYAVGSFTIDPKGLTEEEVQYVKDYMERCPKCSCFGHAIESIALRRQQ